MSAGLWIGTLASSLSAFEGNFESIATVTVGSGGSATVSLSSIPSTYQHLQLRGIAASAGSGSFQNMIVRFNGDTSSVYADHWIYGDGATVGAGGNVNQGALYIGHIPTSTTTLGAFCIDILDYASTSKFKTARSMIGYDANGSGWLFMRSGLWRSTSAITSITLQQGVTADMRQYSTFALYGIKAP